MTDPTCPRCFKPLTVAHEGKLRDDGLDAPTLTCPTCDSPGPAISHAPDALGMSKHRNYTRPEDETWTEKHIADARKAWGIPDPDEQDQA